MKQQKRAKEAEKAERKKATEEGNQLQVEIEQQKALEKEEWSVEAMSSRQRQSRRKTACKESTLGM